MHFKNFEFQSLTSITDTDVELSYDADWGNANSHFPYTYDYYSETLRSRETFSQEFRLVSDAANFNDGLNTEWVLGISYFDVKEINIKNDDGIYGDPSDPFGPYASQSSSKSNFSSKNYSLLEILITLLVRIQSFLLVQDWKIMKQSILIHMESRSTLQIICLEVKSHLVAF